MYHTSKYTLYYIVSESVLLALYVQCFTHALRAFLGRGRAGRGAGAPGALEPRGALREAARRAAVRAGRSVAREGSQTWL